MVAFDLDGDFVAADFVARRGVRIVVLLRVDEGAFVARFAVDVLLLFAGEDLRDDVRRVVDAALDLTLVDFDGVDFFRADDVFVVLDEGAFRFVVVAFLVAIFSLPAK